MSDEKERSWFFISNIDEVKGAVITEGEKKIPVSFRGAFGFRVNHHVEGEMRVHLVRLNLMADGVSSEAGETGIIGLTLAKPEYEARFDPSDGSLKAEFGLTLHYPLIDEKMGFRESETEECAVFVPYKEEMKGSLSATLPAEFIKGVPEKFEARGKIEANLVDAVVGAVQAVEIATPIEVLVLFRPAEVLRIQPVFIGSGPCDPNATGHAFDELMDRARAMWNRCGTVRCISFEVQPAVYLNNNAFRVISSDAEGYSLRLEHNDPNAVEVFVAERMDPPEMWGGGATWGSGTASAFIVTSDQQLDVPCPPPCPGGGDCGDVNYYHLAHEIGHALNLAHPGWPGGLAESSPDSVMEPSGFCADNPNAQSARNCRNASNPLLFWGWHTCWGSPDIMD